MFLAIDAGGTSSRAVALDATGRAYGYGRAGTGNPTAAGIAGAVAAIGRAAEQALAPRHPVLSLSKDAVLSLSKEAQGPEDAVGPGSAVIAMAGEQTQAFHDQLSVRLRGLGVRRLSLQPDLLGIFHSGTHELQGYALIAGTGSVAARVRDGRLDRVVGGRGWLLGDAGSGFWIGRRIARAVISALDGQGATTALTDLVLQARGIEPPTSAEDRFRALRQLVSLTYAHPPGRLAELAPLAFRAYEDPVARDILVAASAALAELLTVVQVPAVTGPVVVGGSVLVQGMLGAPPDLRRLLTLPAGDVPITPVPDGVVGAAVLALRESGILVDATVFTIIQATILSLKQKEPPRATAAGG